MRGTTIAPRGRDKAGGIFREVVKWGDMAAFRRHRRTARLLYRIASYADPTSPYLIRQLLKVRARTGSGLPDLNFVALGTTGTCNASCIHCPTGKAATAHSPRGTMPMEIFRKIIDGIRDEGLAVVDQIGFGLFGDGLLDPLVLERARYVSTVLPDVRLTINTNGAAFNVERHAALNEYATVLTLHCESLVPETYDRLMTPLRARTVHRKYEPILAAFPDKVVVSVPASRANLSELPAIRDWFMARGAYAVVFDPLASRCAEDDGAFRALAFAPHRITCSPSIMSDLIVDCDGLVLACCQDFSRIEPIGNLTVESLAETLRGMARAARGRQLAGECHDDIATCRRCLGDIRTPDFPFDVAPAT